MSGPEVPPELTGQVLRRSELLFIPDFLEKQELYSFSVDIGIEIHQERFHIQFILAEGGANSHIGQRGIIAVVHNSLREEDAFGNDLVIRADIGSGKTEAFPPSFSFDHRPCNLKGMSQQRIGFFDIPLPKEPADETAADPRTVDDYRRNDACLKIVLFSKLDKGFAAAAPVFPEAEILAYDDLFRPQRIEHEIPDKSFRRMPGELAGEIQNDGGLYFELLDAVQSLREGLNHPDRIFPDNLFRMRRECENNGDKVLCLGVFDQSFKYFLVPQMDAVEIADSDGRVFRKGGYVFEPLEDVHPIRFE